MPYRHIITMDVIICPCPTDMLSLARSSLHPRMITMDVIISPCHTDMLLVPISSLHPRMITMDVIISPCHTDILLVPRYSLHPRIISMDVIAYPCPTGLLLLPRSSLHHRMITMDVIIYPCPTGLLFVPRSSLHPRIINMDVVIYPCPTDMSAVRSSSLHPRMYYRQLSFIHALTAYCWCRGPRLVKWKCHGWCLLQGLGPSRYLNQWRCSVRLADLIRTTNAMVVLFSLAEFSLTRVVNRRDFWNRWRFVDQAMLIADLSTLSVMTWHQGKSYNSWEVWDKIDRVFGYVRGVTLAYATCWTWNCVLNLTVGPFALSGPFH